MMTLRLQQPVSITSTLCHCATPGLAVPAAYWNASPPACLHSSAHMYMDITPPADLTRLQ
eukprot:3543260-Pleurochrysis_carterae.AAC.2